MKIISQLTKIASSLDAVAYHQEADELIKIATTKLAQSAPMPIAGGQMYGAGDIPGILTELVGSSIAPYAGQALSQLLSSNTALKKTFDNYVKKLNAEDNKIRSLYNDDRGAVDQSTSMHSAKQGDITTGKGPSYEMGGQREYDISRSMWEDIENPSVAETQLKAFLGQLLAQMGYSTQMGSKALQQGVSNLPYPGARAGDVDKYVTSPWRE